MDIVTGRYGIFIFLTTVFHICCQRKVGGDELHVAVSNGRCIWRDEVGNKHTHIMHTFYHCCQERRELNGVREVLRVRPRRGHPEQANNLALLQTNILQKFVQTFF